MRSNLLRGVCYAAATSFLLSCADVATSPIAVSGSSLKAGAPAPAKVRISQVYGGGGNAGAPWQNDFIELFNEGGTAQSLAGWSVQYGSNTGNFQSTNNQTFALSGSIEPGQYFLIKMAGGATGSPLIAADLTGLTAMSLSAGKVALVDQAGALGCGGTTLACDATQKGHIIDLVGYGNSNLFEGAGAAGTLTNGTSAFRIDPCIDTDVNSADFTTGVPVPHNTGSTKKLCVPVTAGFANVAVSSVTGDSGSTTITLIAELKDANGGTIDDPAATFVWTPDDASIASLVSQSGNTAQFKGKKPGSTTVTVTGTSGGVPKPASPKPSITVMGGLDHVDVTGTLTVAQSATTTLTATLKDAVGQTITDADATYSWTSDDPATAEVNSTSANTAVIKGLLPGGPITINVSATSKGITKPATSAPAVTVTGPPVIVPSTTVVSELVYDTDVTNDVGEAIEFEGNAGATLNGWTLLLYNGNGGAVYQTLSLSGIFPATCDTRGVIVLNFPAQSGGFIQNGPPDGWALVNPSGQVTEFRSYEGTFSATNGAASGLTSTSIGVLETGIPATKSLQRAKNGTWFGPSANTFGACNPAETKPAETITLSGRTTIPLGMQMAFRYDGTDGSGNDLTAVAFSSADVSIATVDQDGIVTGMKVGSTTIFVTAPDGSQGKTTVSVYVPSGSNARVGHNEEFGEPHDADDTDDILIKRAQYTVSYNPGRGGANWVSWNISASHITQVVTRCDGGCYSADTALTNRNPALPAYTTADWVSNINGQTGYDRGHMAPSADWTSSEGDNVTTFFLTNFLPQRADLNQGPWEVLEGDLRDTVKAGREVYVIAGGIFTNGVGLGTLLNKGKIGIPDSTWKIAVITPAGTGINADGTLPPNSRVLAVNMPNVTGIKPVPWETYLTTVAKIERSTGYNFLDLLSEPTECLVEVRNCAPTARITGTFTANEGQSLSFSGATSSDPNAGDVLAKQWTVNNMPAGSGNDLTYTFANDGMYQVKLVVTDLAGANSTAIATVVISNVTPVVSAFSGGTILRGETYAAAGTFSDPGQDSWSGTVSYGDGSSTALAINGQSFDLAHAYATAGTFTVTVAVNDGSATGTKTATVVVKSATQGIADLEAAVGALGLNPGQTNSLRVKLSNAAAQIADGNSTPAANMLHAFIEEVSALAQSGRITATSAAQLTAYAQRVIAAM